MRPLGQELLKSFQDPVVIEHRFGHVVPKLGMSRFQIDTFCYQTTIIIFCWLVHFVLVSVSGMVGT